MTDQNIYLARIVGDYTENEDDRNSGSSCEKELGLFGSLEAAQAAITDEVPLITRFESCDEWIDTLDTTIWRINHEDTHGLAAGWPVEVVYPEGKISVDRSPHIWTCRLHSNMLHQQEILEDNWDFTETWYDVRGVVYLFTLQS